ncbi:Tn7 transposase TnsA N-terminal domain-containing protein [Chryseobacterium cucumeris]|uniref:Tn7 transposase TnsA N-terminal domain-containing protein n=1 Tax=Chryseobacterium cucumeris TaxID=1813611 RepID=UPI0023F376E3|nr:Tn7 transposase TnsA N-terminal domain-containing protein [Chryseobacterium cucumeris]
MDSFLLSNIKYNAKKEQLNSQNSTQDDAKISCQVTHDGSYFTEENANFRKRVREITAKRFSLTGVVNSKRLKTTIQFESSLERDFIYLLEYDDNVKYYLEQPLEIEYIDSQGNKRRYYPDFLIEYFEEQIPRLVEIKYESTLISKGSELREKFHAAKLFCEEKGFEFCVITDLQIRSDKSIELNNFKFLDRYKNFYRNINKEKSAFPEFNMDIKLLLSEMEKQKKITVENLLNEITDNKEKQAELIFLTWYMVSNNFFIANLSEKLTLKSLVWLP